MILTLKANREAVKNAKAKGKAEGLTEAQSWFQQYQSDPDNAPPPPWLANGNGASSNSHAP